jgi:hypothetical protein
MFAVNIGQFTLLGCSGALPDHFNIYTDDADLVEELNLDILQQDPNGSNICFLVVQDNANKQRYKMTLTLGYSPSEPAFHPELLYIPETTLLFIGAGECILVYKLDPVSRVVEDRANLGFLAWRRYKNYVIMEAETEIAVWTLAGKKQWSHFVEPPWNYQFEGQRMHLTSLGKTVSFPIDVGPSEKRG